VEESVAEFLDPNLHYFERSKHIAHTKNRQHTAVVPWPLHMVVGLLSEWCKSGRGILAVVGWCSWDNNSFAVFCMVHTKMLEVDNLVGNRTDMRNCCKWLLEEVSALMYWSQAREWQFLHGFSLSSHHEEQSFSQVAGYLTKPAKVRPQEYDGVCATQKKME
jgi:hypothetical protein